MTAGFCRDHVTAVLIHTGMKNRQASKLRRNTVPAACGRVLEIGIGSALNIPFYGSDVTSVVGIDPSPALLGRAGRAAGKVALDVELIEGGAEALPFESGEFDSVLSTWTLCSIADIDRALAEARRVLKPGGRFIFVEHGRSPDAGVRRWQDRLNPAWRCFAGGCNINRDIAALIRAAGFDIAEEETGYLIKGPRVLTYSFKGIATPA